MKCSVAFAAIAVCSLIPAQLAAHVHTIEKNGQPLANGQNHLPPFQDENGDWWICGGDPASYGLEVAHHGADASGAGYSDGCYMVEDGLDPRLPAADRNPAIR